jgi:HlyD family secretion protein
MLSSPLQLPNFRWLWLGQTLIFAAVQFWFVSLAWLVLQKTGSGLAVGLVLMSAAIPRALFMLIGGAISDRLPPKNITTIASLINAILIGLVTVLLFFDAFDLKYLIVIAIIFGLSEALLYPSILALLPQLIRKSKLAQANAWIQGSEELSEIIGPATAGFIIGAFGITFAFAINTLTFAFGSLSIYLVQTRRKVAITESQTHSLKDEIIVGLRYAWTQPAIRISLLLLAMINLAMLGPLIIGVAALVNLRFNGNATIFGYLQASYGIGALIGVFFAGQLNSVKTPKTALILLTYGLGIGLISLGFLQNIWLVSGAISLMGIACGMVSVLGITWLQKNTPVQMQGRMMGLTTFAAVALDPFSQAISGFLLEVSLTGLFVVAGVTMILTGLISSMTNYKEIINMSVPSFLPKFRSWQWILVIAVGATSILSAGVVYQFLPLKESSSPVKESKTTIPPITKVAALGRLEPENKVIRLNVPLPLEGDLVEELLVKEGSKVSANQVIAILDSRSRLNSVVTQAQEQLKIAQARLSQVKAGAKVGQINSQKSTIERVKADLDGQMKEQKATIAKLKAQLWGETATQQATISRLKAELENAKTECQRYQILYQDGVVSISDYDSKCLRQKTLQESVKESQANLNRIITTYQEQIQEAQANLTRTLATGTQQIQQEKATLNQVSEVRPVDIQIAQAEVDNAFANLQQAKTNLNQVYIKSPINGQIIKIHTRVGEKIGDAGLLELAQTNDMIAIAEIYQTDIEKVKLGQQAIITSQAFSDKLKGTVSQIGLQVSRQNIFSTQPGENLDRRVVEVTIRLNPQDAQKVAGLTNLQVQIKLDIQ